MKTLLFSPRPLFLASIACLIFCTGFVAGEGFFDFWARMFGFHRPAEVGLKSWSCMDCRQRNYIHHERGGKIVKTASCWEELGSDDEICLPLYARMVGNCANECPMKDETLKRLNQHIETISNRARDMIRYGNRLDFVRYGNDYLNEFRMYAEATKSEDYLNFLLPMFEEEYLRRYLPLEEPILARLVVRCEDVPNLKRRIESFELQDRKFTNLYGETIGHWYSVLKVYCPLVLASPSPAISSVPA